MPTWVKVAINGWAAAAGITGGAPLCESCRRYKTDRPESSSTRRPLALPESHPTIATAHAPNCAERLVESWSRCRCSMDMLRRRRPSTCCSATFFRMQASRCQIEGAYRLLIGLRFPEPRLCLPNGLSAANVLGIWSELYVDPMDACGVAVVGQA
jgi:hypothetical protein